MEEEEEGLLLDESSRAERRRLLNLNLNLKCGTGELWEEMKRLGYLTGPMVAVTLSFYLLQVISLMMVGHLGELPLSSTSVAFSLAGVTGFSLLLGMASGLETLSGQAFGAQEYEKLGTQTYTAILSLNIVCIPVSILWVYMGNLLKFIGQDPQISVEAGRFLTWLVPALFGYATLQPLIRYYQMQSLIVPMLISSCITLCSHVAVCWALVLKSELRNLGGAVAMGLSIWLNVIILSLYMKYSSKCARTRSSLSMRVVDGMKEFFCLAIPSAGMICLEWWSFELLILLAGLLPNPQLETSVLSVCLTTLATLYSIPYGLAASASTRISNKLGAGNAQGAQISVVALMLLVAVDALLVSSGVFAGRNVFGYIFSNEKEVVEYVAAMAPLVCVSVVMDSIQGALSGVARGCGWQHIGACINLAAFYLFGIPIAAALGFWLNLRGRGLWIGVLSGATLQSVLLLTITSRTNWEKQAAEARKRLFTQDGQV
ncbi:protein DETOXIFICATION 12-like [Andrographis paniculata]|uniref:protein DETOXIFICATION 12-like n=1 Tax=Andrographis paniculata TaxID=175694 RepID=UPI0021E90A4D|nr:protein DETOXIFICATION 12-like [Andrographis paniculata]